MMGKRGKGDAGHVRAKQNAGAGNVQAEVPMVQVPMGERERQLLDDYTLSGQALALAQSLKCMGEACEQRGDHGHAVIAKRARQFVQLLHMHVTRFLAQPDLRLRHASVDLDLAATHVDVGDLGQVTVHCTDPDGGGWWTFPLDELVPAGPVNDMVRAMTTTLGQALTHNAIGQAITEGKLPGLTGTELDPAVRELVPGMDLATLRPEGAGPVGFEPPPGDDAFQDECPACGNTDPDCASCEAAGRGAAAVYVGVDPAKPGSDETVHHLQVHPHYRLEGGRAVPEPQPFLRPGRHQR